MWSRTLYFSSLLILYFGLCPNLKADVRFSEQPLRAVQEDARTTGNPYFVYVYHPDERDCKRMTRKTWHDDALAAYIDQRFLACKINVFDPSTDIKWIQEHEVYTYPAILFFSANGQLLGKAEGYLAAETLQLMFEKHFSELNQKEEVRLWAMNYQENAGQQNVRTYYAQKTEDHETEPALSHLRDLQVNLNEGSNARQQASSAPLAMARTMNEAADSRILLEVPGLEQYSLALLSSSRGEEEEPMNYGLLVGSYTSFQELETQLGRFRKFWQDDVWVYCEEVNQTPVYKLLVGPYIDEESAQTFAHAMYKFQKINPVVLNLQHLIQ